MQRAYDRVADEYDWNYNSNLAKAEDMVVAQWLAKVGLAEGETVLDLGCGTGLLLELMDIEQDAYQGVDVSGGMLSVAAHKFPYHPFRQEDMSLGFFGVHDLVVSLFGSMNYLRPQEIPSLLRRHLDPGGRFFVMLCSPKASKKPDYVLKDTDVSRWLPTRREVLDLFHPVGWEDVRCGGAFSGLSRLLEGAYPPLGATLMSLESRTLLRWGGGYYHVVTGRRR